MDATKHDTRLEEEFWSRTALAARQGDTEMDHGPAIVAAVVVVLVVLAVLLGLTLA